MPYETKRFDDHALCERCNNMLLAWIINSTESDILGSTAYQFWDDLWEQFYQSNAPQNFQIQREIASLNKGQLSLAAYYTN